MQAGDSSVSGRETPEHEDVVPVDESDPLWHGHIVLEIISMRKLPKTDFIGTCDPYITVHLGPSKLLRTDTKHTRNPDYDYKFTGLVCHRAKSLLFKIKDLDADGSQLIGEFEIKAAEALQGERISGSFPITIKPRWAKNSEAVIKLDFQFFPAENDFLKGDDVPAVYARYFDERGGNRVELYHDAHVEEDQRHKIVLEDGTEYQDKSCWDHLYDRIMEAQKFIYITGWSVFTETRLRRNQDCPTIGEMLRKKADEGVKVYIMVWDEALSRVSMFSGKTTTGLMCTHDEDTYLYFKGHDNISCVKVPREGSDKGKNLIKRVLERNAVAYIFTHHQKTVILDAPAVDDPSQRRVVAFIGGLDICDGRYDTPRHDIFRGLGTTFPPEDFHNPNIADGSVSAATGPRQPWHDIHAFVEGRAAHDIMRNFEERWNLQGSKLVVKLPHANVKLPHSKEDLVDVNKLCISEAANVLEPKNSPHEWRVQVLRSIDSCAADFDRSTSMLLKTIGRKVDQSIHITYVKQIRKAKHFLYIENQYFLGSSHMWDVASPDSDHLIPAEIAIKIVNKINAGEDFAAYVVLPMWPEGIPTDQAIQEILSFQRETVHMMYKIIAKAIKAKGLDTHPTRYLKFFCLGKRETLEGAPNVTPGAAGKSAQVLQRTRRFMIYVHSKMMVVDDEYVIVGSANINRRSMAGARDTEIAIGAYQSAHRCDDDGRMPRAQVHGFRMSCWAEHLNAVEDVFLEPQKAECMQRVTELADQNWAMYTQEEPVDMHSHLMPFPYQIDQNGDVTPLPGFTNLPDTSAAVLGARSTAIPDALTT